MSIYSPPYKSPSVIFANAVMHTRLARVGDLPRETPICLGTWLGLVDDERPAPRSQRALTRILWEFAECADVAKGAPVLPTAIPSSVRVLVPIRAALRGIR